MSRIEKQLMKINGDDVEIEEPQSRIEKQLAYILGADIVLEEPQSRIEELVQQIIDNGGGGGGGGGGSSTYTITLISAPIPEYPDSPASVNYNVNCFDENYTYLGGTIKTNEGYLAEYQTEVWASASQDIEVMLLPSKGIRVMDSNSGEPISVTGDAEIVHHEDWGGYWDVYVTGNCTITYQGSR